ncbi:MAG TPA: zinc-dependent alcohol dehydrogenase, partial [Terriglobales bacterium]|nr:zinc-dependent alcohol dehydrogenase [Terriglobales bacterium]
LHLYGDYMPAMEQGDILGHEFMGEVVELGPEVKNLKIGDRVVVPPTIACGRCWFCQQKLWLLCDNTNPNAWMMERMYGYAGSGRFGYTHLLGGYAGGQAQFVRVPFADVGPVKIPDGLPDEKVLFLTDIFPTGYMAAENCNIHQGDVIAVWGCGPVGQFAIRSAILLGAGEVIAIDRVPERLRLAREAGARIINRDEVDDVIEALKEMTGGRGPDACIEAVGMEAHGGPLAMADEAKQTLRLSGERAMVLREVIQACRKGGTVSVPGVDGGMIDKRPWGAAFGKGLTFRMGQTQVLNYMKPLLERIQRGEIDPSVIITHRLSLDEAPQAYKTFRDQQDGCIKVVLDPWQERRAA